MKPTIIHVGTDVDDSRYHGSALNQKCGKVVEIQCRTTSKELLALPRIYAYKYLIIRNLINEHSFRLPTLSTPTLAHNKVSLNGLIRIPTTESIGAYHIDST